MSFANMRINRARACLLQEVLDALYLRSTSDIHWLTSFDGVFDQEEAHALFLDQDKVVIQSDSRYLVALERASSDSAIRVDPSQDSHSVSFARFLESSSCCVEDKSKAFSIGVEDTLSIREYRLLESALDVKKNRVNLRETRDFIRELRSVKDSEEIVRLKKAQAITDQAFAYSKGFIRPGMSEREVQIELEDHMIRNGAQGLAFPSIVATGPHAASPHAIPGDTRLEAGHAVVIDFGARFGGYCSDMTRTVFLGQPEEKVMRAYEAIRAANEGVSAFLKPGVTGAEAQDLAESILAEAGFAGCMAHSLGHGIGLDVHELPVLARRNDAPLVEGNVVTVEPGIYITDEFGMRLEDFGVVGAKGFEVFTQTGHDPVII